MKNIDTTKIEVSPIDMFGDEPWCFQVHYGDWLHFEIPYSIFCTQNGVLPISEQEEVLESHICLKDFEGLADTIQEFIINKIKESENR